MLWSGLLLAGLALSVMLAGGLEASQAAPAGELAPADMAGLEVHKEASPRRVLSGELVTYTVVFSNSGALAATLETISDTLDPGLTFYTMTAASEVPTAPLGVAGPLVWNGPFSVPVQGNLTLQYQVWTPAEPGWHWPCNRVEARAEGGMVGPSEACITVGPEKARYFLPIQTRAFVLPAKILLEDHFDAGIGAGWEPFLNYHRLEPGQWYWGATDGYNGSGAVTHNCCAGSKWAGDGLMMYQGPGAEQWTNYRVEAKMLLRGGMSKSGEYDLDDGDPIGLWVRGQYEPSTREGQWVTGYYVVVAGNTGMTYHIVRLAQLKTDTEPCEAAPQNRYSFQNPCPLVEVERPGPFGRFVWYTLAVEVQGARIKVFLNGELVIDYEDPVDPFLSGTIGFKTHETMTASFDDVIVTTLP